MSNISKESEFWKFMEINGSKSVKSRGNYISWLRFVSEKYHSIDESIDKNKVEELGIQIKETKNDRVVYTKDKDVSNIKSALNKYLAFNKSIFSYKELTQDVVEIIGLKINTSQKYEIETRIGQGRYRKELIKIWGRCSVSQYSKIDFLIASHIKPWKDSSSIERIDPYNGLLLKPNI